MVTLLSETDSFRKWLETINGILNMNTVDGSFKILIKEDSRRHLKISGGYARTNGEAIYFEGFEKTFQPGIKKTIGCFLDNEEIRDVDNEDIPDIGFIPLFSVETNNQSITSLIDLRTWAFDIDASHIPSKEQIRDLRDEMDRIMDAYNNIPDVFSGDYNDLENKPNLFSGSYNDLDDKPTLFSGSYDDLDDKPEIPEGFSGLYDDLENKPTLFSGSYNDLDDKPEIPEGFSGSYDDLDDKPEIPEGFSGSYDDLENKPSLGTAAAADTSQFATAEQGEKADSAVQGEGINKIVLITKSEYENLEEKEATTFYIIKQQ